MRKSLLLFAALLVAGCAARTYRYAATSAIPSTTGWADLSETRAHQMRVTLQVRGVPPISQYSPGSIAYVVWAMPQNEAPQNLGTLRVTDQGSGVFVATTPYFYFDLEVTPERDIGVAKPTTGPVLRVAALSARDSGFEVR